MQQKFQILLPLLLALAATFAASARERVSILGDSYSTFKGFVQPEINLCWYSATPDTAKTDVRSVKQTWWHQLIKEKGWLLEKNNSFSGATVCTTGYSGKDFSDRAFTTRILDLGSPDIILILGATNDSWAGAPLGDFKYADLTEDDLKSFRPALAYLLETAADRYPNAEIYYMVWDKIKPELISSAEEISRHYGIPFLVLKDIDVKGGHPTIKGMRQIADQVASLTDGK